MYMPPLEHIIKHHIAYHKYADDVQLYHVYDPTDARSIESALCSLRECIIDIITGLLIIICNSVTIRRKSPVSCLHNTFVLVQQADSWCRWKCSLLLIEQWGTLSFCYEHLPMAAQVTYAVKSCNLHLRNIGKIQRYITKELHGCHPESSRFADGLLLCAAAKSASERNMPLSTCPERVCCASSLEHCVWST